jgi:hypothetical protein
MIKKKKVTELAVRIGELEAKVALLTDESNRLRSRLWESNGEIDHMWTLQENLLRALEYVAHVPARASLSRHHEVARDALEAFERDTEDREEFLQLKEELHSFLIFEGDGDDED